MLFRSLVDARQKHVASPLRDKIGLCAILITCHPYTTGALEELAETMKEPFYEKIDGRPLVYMFIPPWEETLARLRDCCKAVGTPDPYAVLLADSIAPADASKVQALSSYSATGGHAATWEEFFEQEMAHNERRSRSGLTVVPHFSMGWNPTPRIKHTVPWAHYSDGIFAPPATEAQLLAAADRLKTWVREHRDICPTGHVLTFAWNEFEEGAWICPTIGPSADMPDTRYRDVFAKIAQAWKA